MEIPPVRYARSGDVSIAYQVTGEGNPIDLVFAPDGIEQFEDAWKRRLEIEGFPLCHLDDIIASKRAANRRKDLESLPRLVAFREYWKQKQAQEG